MRTEIKKICHLLSLISDPTRMLILCSLMNGEKTSKELEGITQTTIGNVSQHLQMLYRAKILSKKRIGVPVYYFISDKRVSDLIKILKINFCQKK